MTRRLSSGLISCLIGFSVLLAGGVSSVEANHLECGTADPHDVLPPNGGRVTVVYESQFLRTPNFPDAALIAGHVKQRAEEALTRYQQLDFPVPPAVTISIKCRLSAVGIIPIQAGAAGFTDDSDSVQLRTDYVQAQFAQPTWVDDRAGWKNLVDHEMFHTAHHLMANLGWDYVAAGEKTIVESGATLAQDFFLDTDDEGDPNVVPDIEGTYTSASNASSRIRRPSQRTPKPSPKAIQLLIKPPPSSSTSASASALRQNRP